LARPERCAKLCPRSSRKAVAVRIPPIGRRLWSLEKVRPVIFVAEECQSASNRNPGSACKRDPSECSSFEADLIEVKFLGSAARRFFIPACNLGRVRAQRRSTLAEGHHEVARSGVDGREHGAIIGAWDEGGPASGSVLEAPAFVAGLDDLAVMGEPVKQRCRHLGVAEHAGPFAEGKVRGDDD
jgi:hypothetical protein